MHVATAKSIADFDMAANKEMKELMLMGILHTERGQFLYINKMMMIAARHNRLNNIVNISSAHQFLM